ncbi:MAG: diguanylate cyclase [Deltaproteobacteria bacterium]|nr:diguanylate cyclase [Deltaproteobacteria bacterium]
MKVIATDPGGANAPSHGALPTSTRSSENLDFEIPGLDVLERIGAGAFSFVYRARHGEQLVALKIQRDRNPSNDARQRVWREAATLARLRHPALCEIQTVGEVDQRVYIVMEYIEGVTLAEHLATGPLTEREIRALTMPIVDALGVVHSRGLIHGDIKPRNILIDRDHRPRLIDFGLVSRSKTQEVASAAFGTLLYASPEQLGILKRPVDARSDLYALGIVLYEMAIGRTPFHCHDAAELVRRHASVLPVPICAVNPSISFGLSGIVDRLLSKDPDDRPHSAAALKDALRRSESDGTDGGNSSTSNSNTSDSSTSDSSTNDRSNASSLDSVALANDASIAARRSGWSVDADLPWAGPRVHAESLLNVWHRSRAGHGSSQVISGPAGIGKSRLVREMIREAQEDRDVIVLGSKCMDGDPVPYSALRQLLEDLAREVSSRQDAGFRAKVTAAIGLGGPYLARIAPQLTLALSGTIPTTDGPQNREHLNTAAVQLFTSLAKALSGNLIVLIDDVQWLDDATLGMLARLDADLPYVPLLLLATGRTEPEHETAITAFLSATKSSTQPEIKLEPLEAQSVDTLVKQFLNTEAVTEDLVARIAVRSQGNPLAVLEYMQAFIDAGHVRYSWGHWIIDEAGLDRLALPQHLMELTMSRVNALEEGAQTILATAALLGTRFDRAMLDVVAPAANISVHEALQAALSLHIIENPHGGRYAFVHDRLREALLARLDARDLPARHRRIAQGLDSAARDEEGETEASLIYTRAHHYYEGRSQEVATPGFEANWKAGCAAREDYAFEEAYVFFEQARELAQMADGFTPPAEYFYERGRVCFASLRLSEAHDAFTAAANEATTPDIRARASFELSKVHVIHTTDAHRYVVRALSELGCRYFGATPLHLGRTFGTWLWRLLRPWPSISPADTETRARTRLILECYIHAGLLEFYRQNRLALFQAPFFSHAHAVRLGTSSLLAGSYASISAWASVMKLRGLSRRMRSLARDMAKKIMDPSTRGTIELYVGHSFEYEGHPVEAADAYATAIDRYRKWMPAWDAQACIGSLASNLHMRGDTKRLLKTLAPFYRELLSSAPSAASDEESARAAATTQLLDVFTRVAKRTTGSAESTFDAFYAVIRSRVTDFDPWFSARFVGYAALYLLVSEEPTDQVDTLLQDFLATKANLRHQHNLHIFTIAEIWIRLRRWEDAESSSAGSCRAHYLSALARLRCGARHPSVRAHMFAAEANRALLEGNVRRYRRAFAAADALALQHDNPWVLFELALVRVRYLKSVGQHRAAHHVAEYGSAIASSYGWSDRLRRIRKLADLAHFGVDPGSSTPLDREASSMPSDVRSSAAPHARDGSTPSNAPLPSFSSNDADVSKSSSSTPMSVSGLQTSRSLTALLQVSLASTTVLDPKRQARVVLDEIVRLLGAERALLFLTREERLELTAGRTNAREDVVHDSSYSRSVVEEVARTRRSKVVGGIDSNEIQVSESVVVHNLRSIVAVPLLLRDRLLGVVYADNTLARGMFTHDDVAVFSAVANHVAIAIETSRTARLEAEVEAERAQRILSEHLGSVIASLGSSLDLQDVLKNILGHLTHLVPHRRAAVLLKIGDDNQASLMVAASHGFTEGAVNTQQAVSVRDSGGSSDLLSATDLVVIRAGLPYPHDDGTATGSLLSVPLIVRDEVLGLLTVELTQGEDVDARKQQVVRMFAGHAAIAVENARLFEEVKRQAISDSLTGLYTRRHFMALAERELAVARRQKRAVAVMMVDVDHFKRINDTYGHPVGDQVLIETAARLLRGVRETDIVGRLGGEEFAVFLLDSAPSGTSSASTRDGQAQAEREEEYEEARERDSALIVAERLRRSLAETPISTTAGPIAITASFGLVTTRSPALDANAILATADEALYDAKHGGRNRVVVGALPSRSHADEDSSGSRRSAVHPPVASEPQVE